MLVSFRHLDLPAALQLSVPSPAHTRQLSDCPPLLPYQLSTTRTVSLVRHYYRFSSPRLLDRLRHAAGRGMTLMTRLSVWGRPTGIDSSTPLYSSPVTGLEKLFQRWGGGGD